MNSCIPSKHSSHCQKRLLVAVLFTAILVILFKMIICDKAKSITKILLFINSLVINDLSLRYVVHFKTAFMPIFHISATHKLLLFFYKKPASNGSKELGYN